MSFDCIYIIQDVQIEFFRKTVPNPLLLNNNQGNHFLQLLVPIHIDWSMVSIRYLLNPKMENDYTKLFFHQSKDNLDIG